MILGLIIQYQARHQTGDVICPELYLDESTAHADLEISEMGTVVSNTKRYVRRHRFHRYHGVAGMISLGNLEDFEFRVGIFYEIQKRITKHIPLFEIAFAEKKFIENDELNWPIKKSLSIKGKKCGEKSICLTVGKHGVIYKEIEISKSYSDSFYIGVITIIKRNEDVHIYFYDRTQQCNLLFKLSQINIFNKNLRSFYGVMENSRDAKIVLSIIRDAKNVERFDEMTSHKDVFNAGDGYAISNYNAGTNFKRAGSLKQAYRGVLADVAFKQNENESLLIKSEYFEVNFLFDVNLREYDSQDSVFEFGFTPKHLIKKHSKLKYHSDAVLISISRCTKRLRLCISYWQNGTQHKIYHPIGRYEPKYEDYNITFGLKIDATENEGSVYYIDSSNKNILHTFPNVSFARPLYPVIGMTDKSFVKARLLTKSLVTRMYSVFGFFMYPPICDS
ncbi:uncharacterized protein LOC133188768 [Saccostrea echinata]|uniref:uncharacterized protein LOC133188768 n=1 Tax=Saccostrea echinata TaxID=191078 RepID=UPI002A8331D9|nr:uncharacterized protein LOC133188768 [Saccostrea echinata]